MTPFDQENQNIDEEPVDPREAEAVPGKVRGKDTPDFSNTLKQMNKPKLRSQILLQKDYMSDENDNQFADVDSATKAEL